MLFKERRRREEVARREAAGESFWTDDLDAEVRVKISDAIEQSAEDGTPFNAVWDLTRTIIVRFLGSPHRVSYPVELRNLDRDVLLSYVEAHAMALRMIRSQPTSWTRPDQYYLDGYQSRIEDILSSHRISFRLVSGKLVPLSSDELHVEVVEPTLRLLSATEGFEKAHAAYLDSLKEISRNDPADAITDAGTALQETLLALGCDGNALGPLIKDARKRGLLAPHDSTLTDGLQKFLHWAAADRSETGDAHAVTDASRDDAWLMVHIVGALIVRLAGSPRSAELNGGSR